MLIERQFNEMNALLDSNIAKLLFKEKYSARKSAGMEIIMNVDLFLETLPYMLKGMVGIFMVTIIIILTIAILNKCSSGSKKNQENSSEEA